MISKESIYTYPLYRCCQRMPEQSGYGLSVQEDRARFIRLHRYVLCTERASCLQREHLADRHSKDQAGTESHGCGCRESRATARYARQLPERCIVKVQSAVDQQAQPRGADTVLRHTHDRCHAEHHDR